MIGPTYPFRGGLSLHTTLLCRYLRKGHDVSFYSFKRQYPAWLFPGRTDRDNSTEPLREAGVEHLLDSLNPWTWLKVVRRILADRPDLVIIPWWTFFWAPQFLTIALLLRLLSKSRLLFICHNVFDHDSRWLSRFCAKTVLPRGDFFIVHSEADFATLSTFVDPGRITLGFLTSNESASGSVPSREEARSPRPRIRLAPGSSPRGRGCARRRSDGPSWQSRRENDLPTSELTPTCANELSSNRALDSLREPPFAVTSTEESRPRCQVGRGSRRCTRGRERSRR